MLKRRDNKKVMDAEQGKSSNDSEWGKRYAFLIVGPKPSASAFVGAAMAHKGLAAKHQNGREAIFAAKKSQSVVVMAMSTRFT